MSLQDRGFTTNLEKLCQDLDNELQRLLDDLRVYLYKERKETIRDKLLFSYEDEDDLDEMYSDRDNIEAYLRDTADKTIERFVINSCPSQSIHV